MAYCPRCGTEITENENFCIKCGLRINDINSNLIVPSPTTIHNIPINKSKTKSIHLILGIVAFFTAALCITLGILVVVNRDSDHKVADNTGNSDISEEVTISPTESLEKTIERKYKSVSEEVTVPLNESIAKMSGKKYKAVCTVSLNGKMIRDGARRIILGTINRNYAIIYGKEYTKISESLLLLKHSPGKIRQITYVNQDNGYSQINIYPDYELIEVPIDDGRVRYYSNDDKGYFIINDNLDDNNQL